MEMCYDGALVMPSSYAVMSEDEMTYVEGGGTFRIKMNKAAVKHICQAAGALTLASVTVAMGVTGIGALVSNAVCNLVYNYLLDTMCKGIKGIDKSWTAPWIPNGKFIWNR
ncbi:MAG: hypothetical protein K2P76_06815 [Lachnospiraceae bacterium]|nr:hypothetical protein [Lachnospiraceae bacterium]